MNNKKIKNLIKIFLAPFFMFSFFLAPFFAVAATGDNPPLVSTRSATDITDSSATLRSGVNPSGLSTLTWFEWGVSVDGLVSETSHQVAGSGTSYINFLSGLFDLSPDTIYYFRPVAQNSAGISYGSTYSFKTNKIQTAEEKAPSVSTRSAADITDSSATLRASVRPNELETNGWFEYGLSTDGLISDTAHQNIGNGASYLDFLSGVSNLLANTVYYFRPVAQNSAGISYGSTYSFKTKGDAGGVAVNGVVVTGAGSCIPIVTTKPATFITKDSASLRALVNPDGRSTSGWFEYGKSYALTNRTESYHVGSGSVDTDLLKYLASLDVNTTYYFRAVAENNCGKAQGSILSFTTEAGPYVAPAPAPKVEPIPTPAPKPAPTPTPAPAPAPVCKTVAPQQDLMAIEISASSGKVGINEKFEYKIKYKNTGIADADNALLKIELPKKIFFEEAKPCKYSFDDNILFFKLGRVNKNESGEINIAARTSEDAKYGEELTATAALDFTNMAGVFQPNVSDSATIIIKGFIPELYSSAALFLAKIPWWLILLILVLASIFWARSGISKSLKKI